MKIKSLVAFGVCLFLVSCGQEIHESGNGTGSVNLQLTANHKTINMSAAEGGNEDEESSSPDISEFSIAINSKNGPFAKEWDSLADFLPGTKFTAGEYTLKAYYGNIKNEGFDQPYYEGSSDFTVRRNEPTEVTATCYLANVKVTVESTEAFQNYFKSFTTTIHSAGGTYVEFNQNESRAAYVQPGDISLLVSLTKNNGTSSTFEPAAIVDAKPRQHYNVKLDVNQNSAGEAVLSVSFDNETEVEPIEILLSDAVMQAPAPTFTLTGFASGETQTYQECYEPENPVKAVLTAIGEIAECRLTTSSEYLLSLGWPAEVDLMQLDGEQRALMESLGLQMPGFGEEHGQMALLDFTRLIPSLQIHNNRTEHSFTFISKDRLGKVTEAPVTLKIANTPLSLAIAAPAPIQLGETDVAFDLTFNGQQTDRLSFRYSDSSAPDSWTTFDATLTPLSDHSYRVNAPIGENRQKRIQAVYQNGKRVSDIVTQTVAVPEYHVKAEAYNMWSNKAIVQIEAGDVQDQPAIDSYAHLYIRQGDGLWEEANALRDGNDWIIDGLNPDTEYAFKATCLAVEDDVFTTPVTASTETQANVPNGNFESEWMLFYNKEINKGGRYKGIFSTSYTQEKETLTVYEPEGWCTVNRKTMPSEPTTENTWYVVASTERATDAANGSYAVRLRNVAWDNNGSSINDRSTGISPTLSDANEPGSIRYRSAGKLFLGSYIYNHTSGTEVYVEGKEFSSRPSRLSGSYKYTPSGNDTHGTITITLENRDSGTTTVLTSQMKELTATEEYLDFSIDLPYEVTDKKATHLKIMICSSNNASQAQSFETANIQTVNQKALAISTGSELYIDNLSFTY